jgi:hypothetical protein
MSKLNSHHPSKLKCKRYSPYSSIFERLRVKQVNDETKDFSCPPTPSPQIHLPNSWQPNTQDQNTRSQQRLPGFLKQLWAMLNNPVISSIQWTGINSFEIKNKDNFSKLVLPMYFKHCKYSSFSRQLHFYQFQKKGPPRASTLEWKHKYLIRGNHLSLHNIQRREKPRKRKPWQVMAADLRKTLYKYQVQIVSLKLHIQGLERDVKVGKRYYRALLKELKKVQDLLKEAEEPPKAKKTVLKDNESCLPQHSNRGASQPAPVQKDDVQDRINQGLMR